MDDKEAFLELYQSINQPPLFAYILGLVADVNEAQDILQETYLKIRSAAHLYQAQGKPMAWIFTIARNLTRMHYRQSERIVGDPIEEINAEALFSSEMDQQDRIVMKTCSKSWTKMSEPLSCFIRFRVTSTAKSPKIWRNHFQPFSRVITEG